MKDEEFTFRGERVVAWRLRPGGHAEITTLSREGGAVTWGIKPEDWAALTEDVARRSHHVRASFDRLCTPAATAEPGDPLVRALDEARAFGLRMRRKWLENDPAQETTDDDPPWPVDPHE